MRDSGVGFLEMGQQAPSPPTRDLLGERYERPSGVLHGAPTAQRFPLYPALTVASPDAIILLIVDHKKKLENSFPIQS